LRRFVAVIVPFMGHGAGHGEQQRKAEDKIRETNSHDENPSP
jgi:hypothetical protein